MPRHPEVNVRMVGEDGNAFSILARVTGRLREAGVSEEERLAFVAEATAGDYDHLLRTVMAWVVVDEEDDEEDGPYTHGFATDLYPR